MSQTRQDVVDSFIWVGEIEERHVSIFAGNVEELACPAMRGAEIQPVSSFLRNAEEQAATANGPRQGAPPVGGHEPTVRLRVKAGGEAVVEGEEATSARLSRRVQRL